LDEAIQNFKTTLDINPRWLFALWVIPYCYALKEDYDSNRIWTDKMSDIFQERKDSWTYVSSFYIRAFYDYWTGLHTSALEDIHQGMIKAESSRESFWEKDTGLLLKAHIHYDRGDIVSAKESLIDWRNHRIQFGDSAFVEVYYHEYWGFMYAKEEQVDSAEVQLDRVESLMTKIQDEPDDGEASGYLFKDNIVFLKKALHGTILLARSQPDRVIALGPIRFPTKRWTLVRGIPATFIRNIQIHEDITARAFRQKGNLDKAISEYEKLVTFNPNSDNRRLIHPKYHYRLAKLYEEKGLTDKAIERYEKFIDIWKDADEDLPEKQDAKARLARLKG
jgi:tetratricopeptide (TPR) repeat protein